MEIEEFKRILSESYSYNDMYINSGVSRYSQKKIIQQHDLDISHFLKNGKQTKRALDKLVDKICPVCSKTFTTKSAITCSFACRNTYFRSGKDHPNYKGEGAKTWHRTIGFEHHDHKCCVCDESLIVEIHHYDNDHDNNEPSNLVPLCPTHHKYIHSVKGKELIGHIVDDYVSNFPADHFISNSLGA